MALSDLFRKKNIPDILHHAGDENGSGTQLKKNLNVRDLTSFGIAAIVGAGIFSTIGTAASNGGPAVSVLFIFTAIACGFSALCYARFASALPISGSAYTYAYASFGELIAWIIGWDLIMEYAVGNIAVAISWSDYFTGFSTGMGMHIPEYLTVDYLTASRGFEAVTEHFRSGMPFSQVSGPLQEAFLAWKHAPQIFGIRIIADVPAFVIVIIITALVYRGIYESKVAGNIMVLIKLAILMVVIAVGAFYVNPDNWSPFAPNGLGGVLKGVSGVFFAYIGFDAISTTAEECRNPQRDLPRSIIYSLLITTVLYVLICLVLTGMAHYSELGVGDPLSRVFSKLNMRVLSGIIALSAIVSMASVLLVFQMGQPRIWMSMSRDGLLPPRFSKLHPRFRTPGFATILTGCIVAVPALFMNLTEVTDLTSIGTLFAFVLVSGGVLILDKNEKNNPPDPERKSFRIPYYNSRYVLPPLWLLTLGALALFNADGLSSFFHPQHFTSGWTILSHKIPMLIFIAAAIALSMIAIVKEFSSVPVIGLLLNLYLMTELGITNWMRFLVWLVIGLALYFTYGYRHSKLSRKR